MRRRRWRTLPSATAPEHFVKTSGKGHLLLLSGAPDLLLLGLSTTP
ncbi:hypothetical protein AB5J62_06755 [Amycolatopsis sp. cg5]